MIREAVQTAGAIELRTAQTKRSQDLLNQAGVSGSGRETTQRDAPVEASS